MEVAKKMTLNQIKKNIIKNGGRIVQDNDFRFLLNGVFYTENLLSPSRILYDFAEIDLPENFFDSAYYICINNKKNQFWHNEFDAFAKELIIFLGSNDGYNLDYFYYIAPPNVDYNDIEKTIKKITE